jgi:hypothetical protein
MATAASRFIAIPFMVHRKRRRTERAILKQQVADAQARIEFIMASSARLCKDVNDNSSSIDEEEEDVVIVSISDDPSDDDDDDDDDDDGSEDELRRSFHPMFHPVPPDS